jgi:hypothetical protein
VDHFRRHIHQQADEAQYPDSAWNPGAGFAEIYVIHVKNSVFVVLKQQIRWKSGSEAMPGNSGFSLFLVESST